MSDSTPTPTNADAALRHLLDEIATLWFGSRAASRDAKLDVGRKSHVYVLARLRQGLGKSERDRYQMLCTRQAAIQEVSSHLGMKDCRVNELVHVAMTVDALAGDILAGSEPPPFGNVCWNTLRQFCPLVKRRRVTRTEWRQRSGVREDLLMRVEAWAILPGMEQRGPALYRRLLGEQASTADVHQAVRGALGLLGEKGTPAEGWGERLENRLDVDQLHATLTIPEDHLAPEGPDLFAATNAATSGASATLEMLVNVCRAAGPQDLAEMLADLVVQNRDARLVAELLLARLERRLLTLA